MCRGRPGVIVAGTGIRHPEHVLLLAHTLGWPVLADPRSGCRVPDRAVVAQFDAVVRSGVVEPPEVVIRLGMPPASKELAAWVARGHGVEPPARARSSSTKTAGGSIPPARRRTSSKPIRRSRPSSWPPCSTIDPHPAGVARSLGRGR